MSDDLVKRLDNLWEMLEEEGFYTKANTAMLARNRIKELEAKLATCEKYRDAYAEMDRIGTEAVRDLDQKLAKISHTLQALIDASTYMQSSSAYNKHRHNNTITDAIWSQWAKQLRISRKRLAELKGDT